MPSIIEVDTIKNKTGTQNTVLSTDGSGNNTLNAGVIKSNTGSNTGLTIASDGQITVNQNNPTLTLGSNTTETRSGTVLQHRVINYTLNGNSAISTNATSMTNTGVYGNFTTIKSSSDSFFIVKCYRGMAHIAQGSSAVDTTFAITTSETGTYAADNNIYGSLLYKNYSQLLGGSWYLPLVITGIFKVGTNTPAGKTSYSANETLHIRMFYASSNASYTGHFLHANSHAIITVEEILL